MSPAASLIAFDLMDTVVRDPFFSEVVGRIGGSLDALDPAAWAGMPALCFAGAEGLRLELRARGLL